MPEPGCARADWPGRPNGARKLIVPKVRCSAPGESQTSRKAGFENGTAFSAVAPSWRLVVPSFDRVLPNNEIRPSGFSARYVMSADAPARSAIPRGETENLGSALWMRGE